MVLNPRIELLLRLIWLISGSLGLLLAPSLWGWIVGSWISGPIAGGVLAVLFFGSGALLLQYISRSFEERMEHRAYRITGIVAGTAFWAALAWLIWA